LTAYLTQVEIPIGLRQIGGQGRHGPAIRLVGWPLRFDYFADLLAFPEGAYRFGRLPHATQDGFMRPYPEPGVGTDGQRPDCLKIADDANSAVVGEHQRAGLLVEVVVFVRVGIESRPSLRLLLL
jgi:hypothetical protein